MGSGRTDAEEVKAHPFFKNIDWKDVANKKLNPPIIKRKIKISTKYDPNIFETTSPVEESKERIEGWSFVDPSL